MHKRFISGVTTGAIIGAAIGMMMVPRLDKSMKRKIKRSGSAAKHMAGDIYDIMMKMGR